MSDVVVIGAFFTDLVFYCEQFPSPGQTIPGRFASGFGGKGSNQAIACHKMQSKPSTHFFSSVGKDAFGDAIAAHYAKLDIKATFVRSEQPTGSAGIYVNAAGQNQIIISQGAMNEFSLDKIQAQLKEALKTAKLIVFQSEMGFEPLLEMMKYCKAHKLAECKIVFNPAPFRPDYDYKQIIPLADFVVPNETEFAALVQKGVDFEHTKVIKTLGEHGVEVDGIVVPAIKVKAVDTTGAGDCWIGAFCAFYAQGESMGECCRKANSAAGISVTRYGTAASFPSHSEIQ
ncbi:Ribokinase [Hexamita inflata]|uniref:Ribokinase n=1 Tax=Hexamita inflata TaxID=28002 RepID=A0AA86VSK7_9EUKA|nr:Ribokinase [Hexamita inflata]